MGFSSAGVTGTNYNYYLTVDASGSNGYGKSEPYEMKISQLWLYGGSAGTCDVVAGLTTIPRQRTSGSLGPNFSGSAGV
jgi:hypothetical protein